MALRFSRTHWRLLLFSFVTLLAALTALRYTLPSGAQAGAECSAPYLVTQTFANGARWQLCWEQRNLDGIVLREVYFTSPGGQQQRVLAMASISQVHVPYDDNSARFHDITDDGFGNENLNDLTPEECPDGTLLKDGAKDVLCRRLETRGFAAKGLGVGTEGELLSLFSVSTSGEYNYIPAWRFLDDGSIEMEMGATGKLQRFTTASEFGWPVRADGTLGTSHIHNYYWRLDFDLGEKADDDIVEEFNYAVEAGDVTARRVLGVTPITTEAGRSIARQSMRSWRIRDGALVNGQERPISYHLEPMQIGHRDVGPGNEPWTVNDFYVTKFNACEKYVSHNPVSTSCGGNLAAFVNGESLANTDLVIWYGLTFHHIPRDEDESHMHAHWDGFRLVPRDWLDESATAPELATCAVGDVSCDGRVDAADALFMLQHQVQLRDATSVLPLPTKSLYRFSCDVSGEGACTEVDALFTLQCAVGLANRFCPGDGGLAAQMASSTAPTTRSTLTIGAVDPQHGDDQDLLQDLLALPLTLSTNSSVGTVDITIPYDPTVFRTLMCEAAEQGWDLILCNVDREAGLIYLSALATGGQSETQALGTLRFAMHEPVTVPFTAADITLTDVRGNTLPAKVDVSALAHTQFLPIILQ